LPELLKHGYQVKVVDLFWYGRDVFGEANTHPRLERIEVNIRDSAKLKEALKGVDAVIHLACISNDPSFEMDPGLGKSINYDAFFPLVQLSNKHGVQRLIYATSSSVYGIKAEDNVTQVLSLQPLTDYSKYKAMCVYI